MPRIDLRVPYQEKDEAKRLGAHWDAASRLWFVPEELDPARFERWLPADTAPNVRGQSYFIAASARGCWRCKAVSRVHGFMLPAGHETLDGCEQYDASCWEPAEEPTLLCYLDWLAPQVAARIKVVTPHYRVAYSKITRSFYWMNLCEHCGAQLGDHETYCEPGHGFLAFTLEQARRISLAQVDEPFAASCGSYSIGVTLFEKMRRL
jgi:Domain of unknown function (DUF5710)